MPAYLPFTDDAADRLPADEVLRQRERDVKAGIKSKEDRRG